jgi:hypothetical protein
LAFITTAAEAPSENWLFAGGDDAALDRRLDLRYALVGGVAANALVLVVQHFLDGFHAGGLVDQLGLDHDRDDLVLRLAGIARGGGTQHAGHAVAVLRLATYLVALGDHLGGLQHVPVDLGLLGLEVGVAVHVLVHLVLHARNRLHTASSKDVGFTRDDALRRHRDGLQA